MSSQRDIPLGVKLLVVFIFLLGFASFALVLVDVSWTGLFLRPPDLSQPPVRPQTLGSTGSQVTARTGLENQAAQGGSQGTPTQTVSVGSPTISGPSLMESSRKSIVLVTSSNCRNNQNGSGTGFVVKPGYVVTNAHVISGCNNIELIDHQGNRHKGTVKAMGEPKSANDLAILKINDVSLPPLPMAKEDEGKPGEKVQTIGFPLVALTSGQNSPTPSNEGVIASYDINEKVFYSQGMNINPGNSGGPVFLLSNRKIIGVAVAKTWGPTTEGVGIFIPSKTLEEFFKKKIGETL
jgi:S1-C subfamily serine protease